MGQMHRHNVPFNVSLRFLKYNFEVDIQCHIYFVYLHTGYTITGFTICLLSLQAYKQVALANVIFSKQCYCCRKFVPKYRNISDRNGLMLLHRDMRTYNSSCMRPAVPVKQHHEHTSLSPSLCLCLSPVAFRQSIISLATRQCTPGHSSQQAGTHTSRTIAAKLHANWRCARKIHTRPAAVQLPGLQELDFETEAGTDQISVAIHVCMKS